MPKINLDSSMYKCSINGANIRLPAIVPYGISVSIRVNGNQEFNDAIFCGQTLQHSANFDSNTIITVRVIGEVWSNLSAFSGNYPESVDVAKLIVESGCLVSICENSGLNKTQFGGNEIMYHNDTYANSFALVAEQMAYESANTPEPNDRTTLIGYVPKGVTLIVSLTEPASQTTILINGAAAATSQDVMLEVVEDTYTFSAE